MKVMRILVSLGILGLFCNLSKADAWVVVPGGIQVNITYTEPNTNSDGTALNDLARTQVFYNLGAGDVRIIDAPATSMTGNGNINQTVVVPWPSNRQGNVTFYAIAIDTGSNISARTGDVIVRFDTLSPGAPRALVISGSLLFFNYKEPQANTDGTPLTDLAYTKVFFTDNYHYTQFRFLGSYPATSPNGGGSKTVTFPMDTFIKGSTVNIFARFFDVHNNVSPLPQVSPPPTASIWIAPNQED